MEPVNVGVGGILALLILREVFGFLKSHRNGRSPDVVTEGIKALLESERAEREVAQAQGVLLSQMAKGMETVLVLQTDAQRRADVAEGRRSARGE